MAAASENGHQDVNGKRTWLVIIGIVVAVVILAAFDSLHRSQVPIRIGHAARETITASIATNGKIEALDNFQAFAPMPTTVTNLRLLTTDFETEGQKLV